MTELETLLEDGSTFALKSHFKFLADTAGSQFAAKIGAGITHLYMDALGYAWRANAVCLSSSLDPHADFIYDGGNAAGHGVVLAEAHGSFAKEATAAKITSAAKRKYTKQVKPYIAGPSPFGQVIHGYSVAFGSKPTATGCFSSISENSDHRSRERRPLHQVHHRERRSLNVRLRRSCLRRSIEFHADGPTGGHQLDRLASVTRRRDARATPCRIRQAPICWADLSRGPTMALAVRSSSVVDRGPLRSSALVADRSTRVAPAAGSVRLVCD